MQCVARELALGGAPIPEPFVWVAYESGQAQNPKALAWLAVSEYFRRFYRVERNGIEKDTLRYDRLEAIFHQPGGISNLLALFEKIRTNPHLDQVFSAAAHKAEVANAGLTVTMEECKTAFESRYSLIQRCTRDSLGVVDVVEIV